MSVAQKTLGELIDELITTNVKIYMTIELEIAAQQDKNYHVAGQLGEKVLQLNKKRRALINAIDGTETISEKSY